MTAGKRLAALLLAAVMMGTLSGCGEAAPPSPTESVLPSPVPSAPTVSTVPGQTEFALGYAAADSLHPLEASDRSNLDVTALVYEVLYEPDGTFTPRPVLATGAETSEDGLTWTVTLKQDAAFSDGTPLTADHVVSSLRAARNSRVYALRLAEVASVRAGEGTVIITLTAPNGNLPALLDIPILLEREEGLPLGTGPYVFDGDGEALWLAANPNWWQGRRPAFDRIPLRGLDHLDERVSAFDSGYVTAVTTDPNGASALGYSSVYEGYSYPTTDMLYVGFNIQQGACADPLVRTALSRAFDRNSAVASLLAGWGIPSPLPVSPLSVEYDGDTAAALSYDLSAAAELLEEAGWSRDDGGKLVSRRKTLTLRFIVNQDSLVKQRLAEYLAGEVRKLGIEVTVDALGWDDYMTALESGNFDLYLGEVRLTGDFDLSALITGALNYGGYWNEEVTALLAGRKAASGPARAEASKALFAAMAEDLPFAALCFKSNSLLIRWGMVKNLAPVGGNPFSGIEDWTQE